MRPAIKKHFLIALILGGLAASGTANADRTYYRWLDDRGNPVHSDRPPPGGVDYEVVSTQTTRIRQVDGEEGAVPPDTEPSVGNEFESVDTADEIEVIKKNPEFCKRARENIDALDSAARVRIRGEDGEYRFLTPDEIQAQRGKAEDTISVHCE